MYCKRILAVASAARNSNISFKKYYTNFPHLTVTGGEPVRAGQRGVFHISKCICSHCTKSHTKNCWTSFRFFHKGHTLWKMKNSMPDLQRFLSEIGTDPREARYWLKQFLNVHQKKPFAVIEIDSQIFDHSEQLDHLASSVSFLQRNALRPVLVIGETAKSASDPDRSIQEMKAVSTKRSCVLSDALREQGLESCILFPGSQVIDVDIDKKLNSKVKKVNSDLIQWCMLRKTVPIIPSYGETSQGQSVRLSSWNVTSAVTRQLQPLKVIKVNCQGGFKDEKNQVIANISLPFDNQAAEEKTWCTNDVLNTINEVSSLLVHVPEHTSVVITSADKVLQELFTHHGSGTFLKITEPIFRYKRLEDVDVGCLKTLLAKSFKRKLSETYFEDVRQQIHTLYLSERYTAAAVILKSASCDVPYLCKFAVSAQAQGEGLGDILWEAILRDFKQLFWRSRGDNPINNWYFKKSEGSWSNGKWTVFWYGISEPVLSTALINKAVSAPESFVQPDADNTRKPGAASSG